MQAQLMKLKLIKKVPINHDCYIMSFVWQGQQIQLQIGQHFRIHKTLKTAQHPEGQLVVRKYTPISPCSQKDVIDLLIKIYRPTPQFPEGGKMTRWIQTLKQNDCIDVQGPFGRFSYKQGGYTYIDGEEKKVNKIFMIAGGSGITPVYQTIYQIIKIEGENISNIKLILLFANKSEEDIVLRKQLESMQPKLTLHYIVDKPQQNWKGYGGYINKQILCEINPLDEPNTLYIHCGPGPMNALVRQLFANQYPNSTIFKF